MSDKRLIDANALLKHFAALQNLVGEYCECFKNASGAMSAEWNCIESIVENAPTIDAVEVVRCRDCKHAIVNQNHIDKPLICCKTKMVGTTDPDWFCAAGERKMDGGAEC